MNAISYILYTVMLLSAAVKLSMMNVRDAVVFCVMWGIVGGFATWIMSGFSQADLAFLLNRNIVSCLGFAEICIMLVFIFFKGGTHRILGYYPGIMVGIPILIVSYMSARIVTGLNFSTLGIITGIATAFVILALTSLSRYLSAGKETLYVITVLEGVLLIF